MALATAITNLQTRRDAIAAEIVALNDTSDPDRYKKLAEQLRDLNRLIQEMESPVEVSTLGLI